MHAQNNPYVDDKVVHFGFSLGVNLMAFGITDSEIPVDIPNCEEKQVLHARVSNLVPGFNVGFITDVRLCRHLNLRFCPGLSFSSRSIRYMSQSGVSVQSYNNDSIITILSIPITVPIYLKWSAEREKNYRPYLIGGGGIEYNVYRDAELPVYLKGLDYFAEVGFGCDFYFKWFKFCPQLTYRIGFANLLTPAEDHPSMPQGAEFYTNALSKITSHALYLTFNFE